MFRHFHYRVSILQLCTFCVGTRFIFNVMDREMHIIISTFISSTHVFALVKIKKKKKKMKKKRETVLSCGFCREILLVAVAGYAAYIVAPVVFGYWVTRYSGDKGPLRHVMDEVNIYHSGRNLRCV